MAMHVHQIPQWKIDEVRQLVSEMKQSKVVGLVNVEGIGSKQLQGIRDTLRQSAKIRMARNTLMIRAIKESGLRGIAALSDHVSGPVAFIFSNQDPFILSKFLSENKASVPAKGGQIATSDIIIPEMNTGVPPGPFISELAALKIPAKVKGGVIHITQETVAVKAGEVISNTMAQMLTRLGLEPMKVQLRLVAAYTDGALLTEENLLVDLDALLTEVLQAHQHALNLSINVGYPTTYTIPVIIAKADMEARNLALNIEFFEPDILLQFLSKANWEALALASVLAQNNPEAVPSGILTKHETAATTSVAETPSKDEDKDKTKKEPEKEDKEEESVTGLGSLFG
ncbi:MAG: 50S ribosomal protein L10 [Candidatus Thorarchaeota archaeon]|nr:50S ribosomal protein L10 [Candidatus Thorarchaeota archaeon]